jgi:hypothetical protein
MCNARSTTPFNKKNASSASSRSESSSEVLTKTAPVCAPEPTGIDISNLSAEDLQSLKQEDPFLYYSIPSVRRAALHFEEPDLSRSRCSEESTTVVKRCTRLSVECHSDLLMGDLEEKYDQFELEQMEQEFSKLLGLEYESLQ